jgi:hypothetical protein
MICKLENHMENRMKLNSRIIVGLTLILASVAAVAQMGPPTPAPELKKLDYFVGNWTTDATVASGPWGAGGKLTDSAHGEWMKGGFFLLNHSDITLPPELGGETTSLGVMGYDADKKVYTEERFESSGRRVAMTGTIDGDTFTWAGVNDYNGMQISSRLTIKMTSPTSCALKYEVSIDGGASWMPFYEGKATKK